MARTSYQSKHHTSSNAAEQTRFQHHKCKKLYNECKLSVRRILKTSPISMPENFTKSQALNKLIQTQS